MVRAGLVLKNKFSDIQRGLLQQFVDQLNTRVISKRKKIETTIQALVYDRLESSPTIVSLTTEGAELRNEFGLEYPEYVFSLLNRFSKSIKCIHEPLRLTSRLLSRKPFLKIRSQDSLDDLKNSPSAEIITKRGQSLNWIDWLCYRGSEIIVTDFYYNPNPSSYFVRHFSRAGSEMRAKRGARWRVPPKWSGDIQKNFVTIALAGIEDEIEQYVIQQIS